MTPISICPAPTTMMVCCRAFVAPALAPLAALVLLAAPLAAQGASATVDLPPDPNGNYAGPFGPPGLGQDRFAQTFQLPGAGFSHLRQFTVNLGDFNTDGSGANLQFQAGIFTVNGDTLGTQLYLSDVRTGSGNVTGFDPFTFTTPGLVLDPSVGTFAILLHATATQGSAMDVIAASAATYAGGNFFAVDPTGQFVALNGIAESAFTAVFDAAPTSTVPEPATLVLLASGLVGAAALARHTRTG